MRKMLCFVLSLISILYFPSVFAGSLGANIQFVNCTGHDVSVSWLGTNACVGSELSAHQGNFVLKATPIIDERRYAEGMVYGILTHSDINLVFEGLGTAHLGFSYHDNVNVQPLFDYTIDTVGMVYTPINIYRKAPLKMIRIELGCTQ